MSDFCDTETSQLALKRLGKTIREKLGIDCDPIPDDKYHRYPAPGKPATNTACWVRLSEDGRYARFGNFITGEYFTWSDDRGHTSSGEYNPASEDMGEDYQRRSREERDLAQAKAAKRAKQLISDARPATINDYYTCQKQISPEGLYAKGLELLVPMVNIDGEIRNVQRILPDCSKYFLKGGQIKGLFAVCGDLFSSDNLYVCEGIATAATVREKSGHPAVAAMQANNLLEVCRILAKAAPAGVEIIVAADNDHRTAGNPGITKGREAAAAIGARWVTPPLPCGAHFCKCTDFNDWTRCGSRLLVTGNE